MPFTLSRFVLAGGAALAMVGLSAVVACSSQPADTTCADSQCLSGNKCVNDGKSTSCRLLCKSQGDCPDKYRCVVNPAGDKTYCAALEGFSAGIAPKAQGQWGASCSAVLEKGKPTPAGLAENPACDTAQSFWCYADNPTDGEAFCTQYDCKSDAECKGGYYCATINLEPSVRSAKRSVKETTTACLPRSYCAPCTHDVDCPAVGGNPQFCVGATMGGKFCSAECQNDGNCRLDSRCVEDGGRKVCKPIAGGCTGDGSLCAPCRSDADCADDGVCLLQTTSRERFCSPKSKVACKESGGRISQIDCPEKPNTGSVVPQLTGVVGVGCETTLSNPDTPRDYCVPFIEFGETYDVDDNGNPIKDGKGGYKMVPSHLPGCWSRDPVKVKKTATGG